ncbi:restriction endonuclease [Enterococcus faecalis]|uniref:restriction endonuclease n=1 Tax=Enterococcus faecalis TaxID=1351 RepID=UPI0021C9756A|nr:restriction endonuclease [Enterococcus faecalis]
MVSKKKSAADILAEESFEELFGVMTPSSKKIHPTLEILKEEAINFCRMSSDMGIKALYGITDGKAVGTIVEKMFKIYLNQNYDFDMGNSGSGVDLPDDDINTDIKVSSIKQPQSSSPYKDSRQKIWGLGYNLLLFVYEKKDDKIQNKAYLHWVDCVFIEKNYTADYSLTKELIQAKTIGFGIDEIVDILKNKNLPGEDATLTMLANEILQKTPLQGQLTISNALQWRLNYGRVVRYVGNSNVDGIDKLI